MPIPIYDEEMYKCCGCKEMFDEGYVEDCESCGEIICFNCMEMYEAQSEDEIDVTMCHDCYIKSGHNL